MTCKNDSCHRQATSKKGRLCHPCYEKLDRKRDPERYYFRALKKNARRRGKGFTLTLVEFREFCMSTGYIEKKGRRKLEYSIDRIDVSKGYSADNIQILSNEDNISKYHCEERCPF